ncbi:hypothetical protein BDZ97DRAFT_1758347 [Flammula alnicola]|nr:hypothetical protein BDZ97DRAFT_1758347 [Flammula alnicola]
MNSLETSASCLALVKYTTPIFDIYERHYLQELSHSVANCWKFNHSQDGEAAESYWAMRTAKKPKFFDAGVVKCNKLMLASDTHFSSAPFPIWVMNFPVMMLHRAQPLWAPLPLPLRGTRTPARAPALPIIVAPLRMQFRVPHLREHVVKVAVPVPRDDALEELRGGYAGMRRVEKYLNARHALSRSSYGSYTSISPQTSPRSIPSSDSKPAVTSSPPLLKVKVVTDFAAFGTPKSASVFSMAVALTPFSLPGGKAAFSGMRIGAGRMSIDTLQCICEATLVFVNTCPLSASVRKRNHGHKAPPWLTRVLARQRFGSCGSACPSDPKLTMHPTLSMTSGKGPGFQGEQKKWLDVRVDENLSKTASAKPQVVGQPKPRDDPDLKTWVDSRLQEFENTFQDELVETIPPNDGVALAKFRSSFASYFYNRKYRTRDKVIAGKMAPPVANPALLPNVSSSPSAPTAQSPAPPSLHQSNEMHHLWSKTFGNNKVTGRILFEQHHKPALNVEIRTEREVNSIGHHKHAAMLKAKAKLLWDELSGDARKEWNAKAAALESSATEAEERMYRLRRNHALLESSVAALLSTLVGPIQDGSHKIGNSRFHVLWGYRDVNGTLKTGGIDVADTSLGWISYENLCENYQERIMETWRKCCEQTVNRNTPTPRPESFDQDEMGCPILPETSDDTTVDAMRQLLVDYFNAQWTSIGNKLPIPWSNVDFNANLHDPMISISDPATAKATTLFMLHDLIHARQTLSNGFQVFRDNLHPIPSGSLPSTPLLAEPSGEHVPKSTPSLDTSTSTSAPLDLSTVPLNVPTSTSVSAPPASSLTPASNPVNPSVSLVRSPMPAMAPALPAPFIPDPSLAPSPGEEPTNAVNKTGTKRKAKGEGGPQKRKYAKGNIGGTEVGPSDQGAGMRRQSSCLLAEPTTNKDDRAAPQVKKASEKRRPGWFYVPVTP